jgi:cysteine desulfurase / selenocysteine lyase
MSIDLPRVRGETPGCERRLHFNNAGASLMPLPVLDAVRTHLDLESRIGGYEAREAADDRIAGVYPLAARLLNCHADEIALLENATRAWNAVFQAMPLQRGDRIITGRAEYVSNFLAFLRSARTSGIEIMVVDDDEHGQVDVAALEAAVDERVKLIALSHVPTSGGLVNPAGEVGKVARKHGIPYLLDACQSVGQMPMDVDEIGCDFLSTTGRKFLRGPRGTGLLFVRRERLDELDPAAPEVGGASWTTSDGYLLEPTARRFETWEASHALQLGLGAAIDYALALGLDQIWARVSALATTLRADLDSIDRITIRDLGQVKCGIVTFTVDGSDAQWLRARLLEQGVNVHVSTAGDTRLDFEARALPSMIRASVHYFNTEEEVARFCQLVAELVEAGDQS